MPPIRHPLLNDYQPNPADRYIIRVCHAADPTINTDQPYSPTNPNRQQFPTGLYRIQIIDVYESSKQPPEHPHVIKSRKVAYFNLDSPTAAKRKSQYSNTAYYRELTSLINMARDELNPLNEKQERRLAKHYAKIAEQEAKLKAKIQNFCGDFERERKQEDEQNEPDDQPDDQHDHE